MGGDIDGASGEMLVGMGCSGGAGPSRAGSMGNALAAEANCDWSRSAMSTGTVVESATCCWVKAKRDGSVVGWLSGEYCVTEVGVATSGGAPAAFEIMERERDRCCGSDLVADGVCGGDASSILLFAAMSELNGLRGGNEGC